MLVLLGTVIFVAATVPVVAAAWKLAGLFSTHRAPRLATTLLLTMLITVLILGGLGLLGLWYPIWQILAAWVTYGLVLLWTRRVEPSGHTWPSTESADAHITPEWVKFITIASLAATVVLGLVIVIAFPDRWTDSLLYHRGMLQDFLTARSLWHIGSFDNGVAYEGAYASNGELFAFWTTLSFGRDFLTGLHGFVWMAALLGVMYTVGRDLGLRKWPALVTATLLFLTPATILFQVGGLLIDSFVACGAVFAIWGILQYVKHPEQVRWLLLVGFSSGLAVGAKLTALVLFALLCAGLVVTAWRRGHRVAWLVVPLSALLPLGPWLLRLWIMRGNPFWPVAIGPLPGAAAGWEEGTYFPDPTMSLGGLLLKGEGAARLIMLLLLTLVFMWGVVVPLIAVSAGGIWRWARSQGLLWPFVVAPVVAIGAHLVTPTTGLNEWDASQALRYIGPEILILGLALGIVRLAPTATRTSRWYGFFAAGIVLNWAVLIVFHMREAEYLPLWVWIPPFAVGTVVGWLAVREIGTDRIRAVSRHRIAWLFGLLCVLVGVVTWVARDNSWFPTGPAHEKFRAVYEWAEGVHDANIAFVAMFRTPLGNPDLSNTVYYLGEPRENHGVGVWQDVESWIQALKDTCTDYVAVGRSEGFAIWYRPIPEWQWTQERSDVFRRVAGNEDTAVYEFLPRTDKPDVCRDPMP